MTRFSQIVADIRKAEKLRKLSESNAVSMFDQARVELATLRNIRFTVPSLDSRDGNSTYAFTLDQDRVILHSVHKSGTMSCVALSSKQGEYTFSGDHESELFEVANHLMAST